MTEPLSSREADVVMDAAVAKAAELGADIVTIAVLDGGGHPMSIVRLDDRWFEVDLAVGKAYSAVALGMDTNDSGPLLDSTPFWTTVTSLLANRGGFGLGGLLLRRSADGDPIGAIGAIGSSGDEDIAISRAGVDALLEHGAGGS